MTNRFRFKTRIGWLFFIIGIFNPEALMSVDRTTPLIIDHRSIQDFGRIPTTYIQAASRLTFVLRNQSVGMNIGNGLDCLMNNFPGRTRRPTFCDRGLRSNEILYNQRYNRLNWRFEFRELYPVSCTSYNCGGGWYGRPGDFIERFRQLAATQSLATAGFKFCYLDGMEGSTVGTDFFKTTPSFRFPNVADLEAAQRQYPRTTFIWWTMTLCRAATFEMKLFNVRQREYALLHNKVLFDLADITSHRPDGTSCFDNRNRGVEAICQDYTNEVDGGHLNARGMQRVAKAFWVLMARVSGWQG
jgi:hypothetical protein